MRGPEGADRSLCLWDVSCIGPAVPVVVRSHYAQPLSGQEEHEVPVARARERPRHGPPRPQARDNWTDPLAGPTRDRYERVGKNVRHDPTSAHATSTMNRFRAPDLTNSSFPPQLAPANRTISWLVRSNGSAHSMRAHTLLSSFSLVSVTLAQTGPGGVGNAATNVVWLRADDGVNLAGTTVVSWQDRSGNNNHAVAPSVAARPLLAPSVLNGYPVITFDGTNDELRIPDAGSLDLTQWDFFLVNSIGTMKNNNAWFTKTTSTAPNYGLWSTSTGAAVMPIYDVIGFYTPAVSGAGVTGPAYSLLEYSNTVTIILFVPVPRRNLYVSGANVFNDITVFQLPQTNNNPLIIGNAQGAAGWNLNGNLGEVIGYNAPVNPTQRVIINNYLAAKFGQVLPANDIYTMDNAANGNYDHEMAGIGRLNASSSHLDSKGSGAVRINNATGLNNNEFLLWGHDNGILGSWGSTDLPVGIDARWFRVWRVSEVNSTGGAVDVGNVDMTFDLTGQGPVTAADLRLLVDINNNGIFADDVPVPIAAAAVGGNNYRFAGVSQLVNGRRFTLGTINWAQTPLPVELLYFNAKATPARTVDLGWATASEHDNSHFTVERSRDGNEWEEIMDIPAVGNSTNTTIYSEVDRAPLADLSYYRLRQTDINGTTSVSPVVAVRLTPVLDVLVFPDPAQDVVNLVFDPAWGKATLQLINELGQTVPVPTVVGEGSGHLDVTYLPEGNYVVMIITDQHVSNVRLIVAR